MAHTSGLIYHSLHLASLSPNKYTTAYTVISGVCLQLVHFHSPTLSRGKERGRVGKKREKGRNDGEREGAIGKEREGLWGVFLSWREIAL